jgi:hypothetical protein
MFFWQVDILSEERKGRKGKRRHTEVEILAIRSQEPEDQLALEVSGLRNSGGIPRVKVGGAHPH